MLPRPHRRFLLSHYTEIKALPREQHRAVRVASLIVQIRRWIAWSQMEVQLATRWFNPAINLIVGPPGMRSVVCVSIKGGTGNERSAIDSDTSRGFHLRAQGAGANVGQVTIKGPYCYSDFVHNITETAESMLACYSQSA